MFNATFNNISVISWRSVLLVEDPEKTTDLPQATDKLYHIMLYTSPWAEVELTASVVTGMDYVGSCKSYYHMITATTAPLHLGFWGFVFDVPLKGNIFRHYSIYIHVLLWKFKFPPKIRSTDIFWLIKFILYQLIIVMHIAEIQLT